MPESRDRSSVCAVCTGRPSPRFEPPPTSSSGSSAASASATASRNSFRSAGAKQGIKKEVTLYREGRQGYAMVAKGSERLRVLCVLFALKEFFRILADRGGADGRHGHAAGRVRRSDAIAGIPCRG